MSFVRILVDSFVLLKKSPRFYIPKILIAFLFFPMFILLPYYLMEVNFLSPEDIVRVPEMQLIGLMVNLVFILAYTVIVNLIDSLLVNPMYPLLVQQYYKDKKINFRMAFATVIKHLGTIAPVIFVATLLIIAAMLPFMLLMVTSVIFENTLLFYLSIFIAFVSFFAVFLLFYLIYPISTLEKFNVMKTLKQTMRSSLKHKRNVAKAFFISLTISGVSYLLGFMIAWNNSPDMIVPKLGLFLVFIGVRILIAIFTTYQYVLNAVFYMGLEKGVFLGK